MRLALAVPHDSALEIRDEVGFFQEVRAVLANQMRDALPKASFIGFTGTPIESGDKNTQAVFGDYIDVYDILQSKEDKGSAPAPGAVMVGTDKRIALVAADLVQHWEARYAAMKGKAMVVTYEMEQDR